MLINLIETVTNLKQMKAPIVKVVSFLIFFVISKTYGQVDSNIHTFLNEKGELMTEIVTNPSQNAKGVLYKGSPFFQDEFQLGEIKIAGGKVFQFPLLYNLNDGVLIAKIEGENHIFSRADSTSFTLGEHRFVSVNKRFYEVLYDGKVKLLLLHHCHIKPIDKIDAKFNSYIGEFIKEKSYYFLLSNGKIKTFNPNKLLSVYVALQDEGLDLYVDGDALKAENIAYVKRFLAQNFPNKTVSTN